MKVVFFKTILCLFIGFLMSSCIREERANVEADIEKAKIAKAEVLLQDSPTIENNSVIFRLKEFSGSYKFAPIFELSPGAKIHPESGTELDFKTPQKYVVTSEDGQWKKEYEVSFVIDDKTSFIHLYSFENVDLVSDRYHSFYDLVDEQKKFDWATANQGYNIIASSLVKPGESLTPLSYPTAQIDNGYNGKGVKLETKTTGSLGAAFGSPIAAGNFFLGTFRNNLFSPLKSTRFGITYNFKSAPKLVTGYFKYKAGEILTKKDKTSTLEKDTWDAYAILFEKTGDNVLYGNHGFNDSRIVSIAKLKENQRIETDEWTKFELPFEFVNGKIFDGSKEYMFTIVFTSSKEGAVFNGAVGSTLYIDEVQVITQ